jgi:GNAT superfamily N-acetyltransferase
VEKIQIKEIAYKECYDLRLRVLKRKEWNYDYQYAGDDNPTTFHLGVFNDHQLVTIASFFSNRNEHIDAENPIQLRGMATLPEFQGKGLGRLMIRAAIDESRKRSHDVLWCNAREEAVKFYEKLGFQISSNRFEIPKVGPHFVMHIRMDS